MNVIQLDVKPTEGLSFLNMVEAHVLAAIRRWHGIPLYKIRDSLKFVSKKLKIARPLADAHFQTDGVDLFVETMVSHESKSVVRLINVSKEGQLAIGEVIRAHLKRISRDEHCVPIKLYPFNSGAQC